MVKEIIAAAICLPFITQPSAAGVIDQVKNRVDAIKQDTGTLKTRTSNLVTKANEQIQRLDEVGATVNTVIAETDAIKLALEPIDGLGDVVDNVRGIKERFAELQFDPSDLLQNDELQGVIEKFRQQRAEAEERLNDPDLDVFRAEFLEMLSELRTVAAENVRVMPERTPLQTLVEAAPAPVVAALKFASESVFADLKEDVVGLAQDVIALRDLEAFDYADEAVCLTYAAQKKAHYFLLVRATKKAIKVIRHLKLLEDGVTVKAWELGIHGYTSVKVRSGEKVKKNAEDLVTEMEAVKDLLDLKRETVGGDVACE